MRRESRQFVDKAIASLIMAIELFNRPHEQGRLTGVLFFLQHAFEMLLKAVINEKRGSVFPPGEKRSYGFDKCCGICRDDIGALTEDETRLLGLINDLRDAETHYVIEVPEPALYAYAQGGIDVFKRVLSNCFNDHLANHLPGRVLPLSATPPRDIKLILEDEMAEIARLVAPGRRQGHVARARLRHVMMVDAAARNAEPEPDDRAVNRMIAKLRRGDDWREVLPGAAVLSADPDAGGPTIALRIERQGDHAVRYLRDDEDPDSALVVREVSELDRYPFGCRKLAEKLPITEPKMRALIAHLGLKDDEECFKVIRVDGSTFPRYSVKALERLRAALAELDDAGLQAIWCEHGTYRGKGE